MTKSYTTETPYEEIRRDLISEYAKYYTRDLHQLDVMHEKWARLGKLARTINLTGMKY